MTSPKPSTMKPPNTRHRSQSFSSLKSKDVTITTVSGLEDIPRVCVPVSCQIGITHGRVCVGMVGGSTRCEYTLHGVLVNRAARLMSLSSEGVILCDQNAYNGSKREVEFDAQHTSAKLKGERKPVSVYRALRKAMPFKPPVVQTKIVLEEVKFPSKNAGCVGRAKEKQAIDKYLSLLNGEQPWSGMIGIQGETGIGKSLMLQYVAKRAHAPQFRTTTLSGFALDTESTTPFFAWKSLVIQLIEKISGTKVPFAEMTEEKRLECLMAALPKQEYYPLLSPFVDEMIAPHLLDDNDTTSAIVRAQRSKTAMETAVSMVTSLVTLLFNRGERLVLIMDDVQWMDAPSLELLHMMRTVPRLAMFVSFADTNKQLACTEVFHLEWLSESELGLCMSWWIGVSRVSEQCIRFVYEKTHGNPLFSEELCALMKANDCFLVLDNDTCVLSMKDQASFNLPSSIQQIMTATLDRLSAPQQSVIRVAAMMGLQCTLHDLGGVFRAIQERKTMVGGDDSNNNKDDDDSGLISFQAMLSLSMSVEEEKQEPMLPTLAIEHPQFQELKNTVSSIVNLEQTLSQLVEKGILEEKRVCQGKRSIYIFRHLLLKFTCLEQLRDEVKQGLHSTIGLYYEERPMADVQAWYSLLAEHFFHAKTMPHKAIKYLQLAGEIASENHAYQNVLVLYTRLISLVNEDVSHTKCATWHRKVAESLLHLQEPGRSVQEVEEHLHKALNFLQLNLHVGMAVSDVYAFTQTPPVQPRRKSSFSVSFAKRSNSTLQSPALLKRGFSDSEAPPVIQPQVLERKSSKLNALFKRFSRGEEEVVEEEVPAFLLVENEEEEDPVLLPRLVSNLKSFKRLRVLTQLVGTSEKKTEAVEVCLEACAVYDLLSTLQRDRNSVVALERRLNAIILAETANASFSLSPLDASPILPELKPSKSFYFSRSPKTPDAGALVRGSSFTLKSVPLSSLKHMPSSSDVLPHVQQQKQRSLDELSRAYARASVFFSGMHPHSQWRCLAQVYFEKALCFLNNNQFQKVQQSSRSMVVVELTEFNGITSEFSENLVNLQIRCGKFDTIQGNFREAKIKLRFAVWGAQFMHLEATYFDAKVLRLAVFFFNGELKLCNNAAADFFEKNTPWRFVAIGTRFMALCGAYNVAITKLYAMANAHVLVQENNGGELEGLEPGLLVFNDANAFLAWSLVSWRVKRNAALAIRAALLAAECVLAKDLLHLPLSQFHVLALCFTALWDPIREEREVAEIELIVVMLQRLSLCIRNYALVYRVCRPHTKLCFALKTRILQKLGREEVVVSSSPVLVTSPKFSTFTCLKRPVVVESVDLFREVAQFADQYNCFWVQGSALLEVEHAREEWKCAKTLFQGDDYASFELKRCLQLLGEENAQVEEDQLLLQARLDSSGGEKQQPSPLAIPRPMSYRMEDK